MDCDVFDTYVTKPDRQMMHFDIIVPKGTLQKEVLVFGRNYLRAVGIEEGEISAEQCRLCHVEQATPEMVQSIEQTGYFILAMEGCPPVVTQEKENYDD